MIYVSIDTETSGLDTHYHQVLSIAAIIEDTETKLPFHEIPKFHCIVLWENITGDPAALVMNAKLINTIADYKTWPDGIKENALKQGLTFASPNKVMSLLENFLINNGITSPDFIVAGANFSDFDNKILHGNFPEWRNICKLRRCLEPSHYFLDWINDQRLPSLKDCKKRAGLPGEVAHDALLDAWDVIELLRTKY